MLFNIFRFELAFHSRQPLLYVVSLVIFLLTFGATTSDNIQMGGIINNININSPYNVVSMLSSLSFISSLIAGVAFASGAILRDFDHKTAELFFTTRVDKLNYLLGRFCGAIFFCFIVYFIAALGAFFGELMPWIDPERLGPMRLDAYWFATWAIAIPNILMISSLVFMIATLTRSLLASYVALIATLVLSSVITSLVDPEDIQLLSMLDPFGTVALAEVTRYWTPFEMNELLVTMEGNLLINRLLAVALTPIFAVAAYRFFPFSLDFARKKKTLLSKLRKTKSKVAELAVVETATPSRAVTVTQKFDFSSKASQFLSLVRIEFHNIIIGKAFLMMALLGMVQIGTSAFFGLAGMFGTEVYPTTNAIMLIINGSYTIPLVAVLVFYSSELFVRERNVGIFEMVDSMPQPNAVVILAKLTGLMSVIAAMLIAAMFAGMLVQTFKGYYQYDILQYLFGMFSFFQFPIWFTCVLAVFAQVLTGNRYIGMFIIIAYFVSIMFLPQLGYNHNLYLLATPQIPYSIFTGWGPNLEAFVWFSIYWTSFCILLIVIMQLLWPRGSELKGRFKWSSIRSRMSPVVNGIGLTSLAVFIASGSFIFYNTNVLNTKMSQIDTEESSANYEKTYKQFEGLLQPDLIDLYSEVDIFPQRREAHIEGVYTLQNNTVSAIEELHFTIPSYLTISDLNIPDSEQQLADKELGYYIYALNSPMQSGQTVDVAFTIDWLTPGFVNNSPTSSLLNNGTFFNNTEIMPMPGYQQGNEILDNNRRRRYDLPPAERMAKIDDESMYTNPGLGTGVRVGYESIVSTSTDQIAVTPGYLVREWEEGGRRYFHYRMDQPIWPFVSYLSADYEVKADKWNDVDLEVYYKHEVNVDRMIEATQKSLDYFTENFSPYLYRQYRIFEFPRQRGIFAQSFPNTIPFSEAIGFVADIRDPKDIDYVFYVSSHELAHQWWAHQLIGANVQGSAVLTETLSQYSALMVMEKEYGQPYMQRFLRYEQDNYLFNRGSEVLEELPLMLVENQGYIHYRKGSLVLYALKDALGEDTVNRVLREFIEEWGNKGAPYPTTRHLIAKFREVAAPEYQSLITDLFEKIVIFDLRAEESFYSELDDGRFEVIINTSASKFEADGAGEETSVIIDSLIDVAVLGEEDEAGVPEVLHLEKLRINKQEQSFTFVVNKLPLSVGIDPFNKMIDRNPDDNTRTLELSEE